MWEARWAASQNYYPWGHVIDGSRENRRLRQITNCPKIRQLATFLPTTKSYHAQVRLSPAVLESHQLARTTAQESSSPRTTNWPARRICQLANNAGDFKSLGHQLTTSTPVPPTSCTHPNRKMAKSPCHQLAKTWLASLPSLRNPPVHKPPTDCGPPATQPALFVRSQAPGGSAHERRTIRDPDGEEALSASPKALAGAERAGSESIPSPQATNWLVDWAPTYPSGCRTPSRLPALPST